MLKIMENKKMLDWRWWKIKDLSEYLVDESEIVHHHNKVPLTPLAD